MLKVTIVRKNWSRGEINRPSFLLNRKKQQCCLGFACSALGFDKDQLHNQGTPKQLVEKASKEQHLLLKKFFIEEHYGFKKWITAALLDINDDVYSGYTEEEREMCIADLGKEIGIEFTFVD